MLKGFKRKYKPLELLTADQEEEVHQATLAVLEEPGIRFEDEWALDFFKKHGCAIDRDKMRVRFPSGLVEDCLSKAPSSFRVRARDSKDDLMMGGNRTYFTNACGMQYIDLTTLEPRPPTKKEFNDYISVLDSLPNHHRQACYPLYGYRDVPPVMAILETCSTKIRNSTKVQNEGYSFDGEVYNIRMVKETGGELLGNMNSAPPLTWYGNSVMMARRMVEADFPVFLGNGCVYGGTGPATIPGSVVTSNAELISMLVLYQLLHPGHRVTALNFTFPQNMTTGQPAFADVGCSLNNAIFNQMWRRYGVPTEVCPGYITAKGMEFQAGYEKGMGAIVAAVTGANMIWFHGAVSSELTAHPVQAIMDDDIAGWIGRFLAGETIDDETIPVDLIEQVGPIPGHFLSTEHTRKWWKKEQFIPKATDRLTYPEWVRGGKKVALDYAQEKCEEILTTHQVSRPLTNNEDDAVRSIMKEAREYYRDKGLISQEEWAKYSKVMG